MALRRTTINIEQDLLDRAREYSGLERTTDVVHEGLRALIARGALRRIADMAGAFPDLEQPRRRRSLTPQDQHETRSSHKPKRRRAS